MAPPVDAPSSTASADPSPVPGSVENADMGEDGTSVAMSASERSQLFKSVYPGLIDGLKSGERFAVDLDDCPFDDAGWDGQATDPLGRLLCGETYSLAYDAQDSTWTSTGVDEYIASTGADATKTISRAGGEPLSSSIYIWGVRLQATKDGSVYTRDGERIGSIRRAS